ncbi:magnesium transporter CorA family protein [Paenibacillus sp. JX-17]|uniref:Magnesium transporter CorA family protein n=1 Tax=Paenibacillus lacisoli TaxID=3064525 RepID=A0ABT9CEY7_9BACL|nr:magnesium transporter CorA family protein [Paenibacillus sp. JX-17]MDO7907833.1 magnesium transporter CorA family protein [Paenibacillus sp. JX-17]
MVDLQPHYTVLSFAGSWEWVDIAGEDMQAEQIQELKSKHPETVEWLKLTERYETNYISVRFPDGIHPVIFGTLLYSVKEHIDSRRSCNVFHFYVSRDRLFTVNLDEHTRETMKNKDRTVMLHQCGDAVDGMFVLARTVLHYFQRGMDRFEINLRELEDEMHDRNTRTLMDRILDARFELLFWSNLCIPFAEFITASKEAFTEEELNKSRFYSHLFHRVERLQQLINHYEKEISTLISIDDAVSAFRGNEIMKTLTIVTSVFTPATVVGAIWGMNFENLPWIKTGWGFAFTITFTLSCMAGMYGWMRAKGWTGDLLKNNSKRKNL